MQDKKHPEMNGDLNDRYYEDIYEEEDFHGKELDELDYFQLIVNITS